MNVRNITVTAAFSALSLAILVGCSNQAEQSAPQTDSSATNGQANENTPEGLLELSETDRTAAAAQKVCPVTKLELGSMGEPPKVTINDREVFLWCSSCEQKLRDEPAKYLAALESE